MKRYLYVVFAIALAAVLCVAVAVNIWELRVQMQAMASEIDSLNGQISDLDGQLALLSGTSHFVFEFPLFSSPEEHNLVVELTFTIKEGNLSILAQVRPYEVYYIGVVTDDDNDGQIVMDDIGYQLHDNRYRPNFVDDTGMMENVPYMLWMFSPFHTYTRIGNETTFDISLPLSTTNPTWKLSSDLIHVCVRANAGGWVQFHFQLEL